MAKAKVGKGPAELRPYLKRHPGTDAMELLITDVTGVFRGKRIRGNEFTKVFSDGFCLPGSAVLLNTLGDEIPGMAFGGGEDGDPDVQAKVVSGSLAPVPWAAKATAQAPGQCGLESP